jgi:hypothetical protein
MGATAASRRRPLLLPLTHCPFTEFVARGIELDRVILPQRTYTTTNLYHEQSLLAMEEFLESLQRAKMEHLEELPEDTETTVYLAIAESGKEYECMYYLVDHRQRVTFWLNEYDASRILYEADSAKELSHIREFAL